MFRGYKVGAGVKPGIPKVARKLLDGVTWCLNKDGYWVGRNGGYRNRYLHRVLMEIKLGRKLKSDEVVHHRNGQRWDCKLRNLVLMSKWDHDGLSARCPYTGKFLNDREAGKRGLGVVRREGMVSEMGTENEVPF